MRDWQATLFDHGWMIPGYPPELGGRNCTPVQTLIYLETLAGRRLPRSGHFPGYAIVAPSLLEFGNDEQKALAPAAIRGDTIWCIGMSEPNAGSDLAGLQTRAERARRPLRRQRPEGVDELRDDRRRSASATCAPTRRCRSTRASRCLIIDMDTPGIEIRPLRHINGTAGFAEVFFTDVVVPRENLVGQLNGGWAITQGSLAHERAGCGSKASPGSSRRIDGLVELARETGRDRRPDHPPQDRRRVRARVVAPGARLQGLRVVRAGLVARPSTSYMKMATSEAGKAAFELGMEICRPVRRRSPTRASATRGRCVHGFFMSFANTIAGGSSEIQRNIIAQRVLGLPRTVTDGLLAHRRPGTAARHRAASCSSASARPRCVRAHIDDPSAYEPLWRHLARVHRARRRRRRPTSACSSKRPATSPRPARSSRDRAVRARSHRRRRCRDRHGRARAATPTRPSRIVLEADRVERIAVVVPGPDDRGRRRRRRRPAASSSRPSTSPGAVPHRHRRRSTATPQPLDARRAAPRGATARTSRSRPRWSAPRVASSTWRSRTRRSASSSTCRSVRSKRSSTSSPTCRSRSNARPRPCTTRR